MDQNFFNNFFKIATANPENIPEEDDNRPVNGIGLLDDNYGKNKKIQIHLRILLRIGYKTCSKWRLQ